MKDSVGRDVGAELARIADALERLAAVAERDEIRSAARNLARLVPELEHEVRDQHRHPPRPVRVVS